MTKTPTRGAVLYTRVSTGEQDKHGTSPETQRDACRTKAGALSLPIVAEYHDGGISGGFLLARDGFQKALGDIRAGRADTLICANISRYSRDVEHQQAVKKAVRAAGGQLVFCDVDLADTPEGDLMFSFLGGYAQYERQTIRTRTMAGRRRRAEAGIQPNRTFAPLGYHIPTNKDILSGRYPPHLLGQYVVLEEQAALVQQMFQWYGDGVYSLAHLARHLNQTGVPTVRGGKIWRGSTLFQILTNPVYKGEATYGKHQHHLDETRIGTPHAQTGRPLKAPKRYTVSDDFVSIPCPALVSEELWEQVQARLSTNRTNGSGNPQRLKMLSGLIRCPGCGGPMTHSPERFRKKDGVTVYAHYRCEHNIKKLREEGVHHCNAKTYRMTVVESAVISAVLDAVQRPECVQAALDAYRQAHPTAERGLSMDREKVAVQRGLEALEEEQKATVKAQIAGIIAGASPAAYDAAFADIAARRQALEQRREEWQHRSRSSGAAEKPAGIWKDGDMETTFMPESLEAMLRDICRVLASPQVEGAEKRQAVGLVVERVVCQKAGADVTFRPGVFGEDQTVEETVFSVLTAWASYLGL